MAELIGYIFTLNAIITWAGASLVYKWGLGKTQPKANLFFRLCCVSLGTFIFSLIFGDYAFLKTLNQEELTGYIISCLISGLSVTVGDLLYYMSLKKLDASRTYPLVQLSLVFVIFFSLFLFDEEITPSILIGSALILSSVFILSSKDKSEIMDSNKNFKDEASQDLIIGVLLAVGTAFCWALSSVSFNQARIITNDVFVTNFFRVSSALFFVALLGIRQREYYAGFKRENRKYLKFYLYIGLAGVFSLGLADTLYYKAAELNGLILTSAFTINTPMVQQLFSVLILKEKFRKRFLIAVFLIIIGNYIIIFL